MSILDRHGNPISREPEPNGQPPSSPLKKIVILVIAIIAGTAGVVANIDETHQVVKKWIRGEQPQEPRIELSKELLLELADALQRSPDPSPEVSESLKTTAEEISSPRIISGSVASGGTEWLQIAMGELGQTEVSGSNHNQRIIEYIKSADASLSENGDELPWVSFFVNWCLEQAGVPGTNSGMARSWAEWGAPIETPKPGAVAVFKRPNHPWAGSVGFYLAETETTVVLIAGNFGNAVRIVSLPKEQLIGYRWPSDA